VAIFKNLKNPVQRDLMMKEWKESGRDVGMKLINSGGK
jgi:hypothetical protein